MEPYGHRLTTYAKYNVWKTQLFVSEIWDEERFDAYLQETYDFSLSDYLYIDGNRSCALIGKNVVRQSHSDCDGDLLQFSTLPGEYCQELMKSFKLCNVTEKMLEWDRQFLVDEYSSIKKMDWTKPYTLSHCKVQMVKPGDNSYIDLLTNSAMAKNATGPGTNNAWQFGMLQELYLGLRKDGDKDAIVPWSKKGKEEYIPLTEAIAQATDHINTETVERYVINAIKHIRGGASQHEKFMLRNLGKNTGDIKEVLKAITGDMGYSHQEAMIIICVATWAHQNGLIDFTGAFLKMHNKGENPIDLSDENAFKWFERLAKYTFFGRMVAPVFDIYKQTNGLMEIPEIEVISENDEEVEVKETVNVADLI